MANSARIDDLKKKFDENPRRYFAPLANEYRKAGDPDQAIAICREFLPQQPGHMSGHIVYGQALYDAQQLDEAKLVFDTALTLDPENLIALRYLGDIARGLGDPASARAWYQRVLDADPRNDEIAGLLTELANAPQTAPAEPPPTGSTEPVVTESVSPEGLTGSAPPETEPVQPPTVGTLAEPAQPMPVPAQPIDGGLFPPEPEPAAVTAEPVPAAAAEVPLDASAPRGVPPEASAPPADELLDLDDLDMRPAEPPTPQADMPRPSLETTGFDIERADDGLLMPTVEQIGESMAAAAAESDVEPVELEDAFPLDELDLTSAQPTPVSTPTLDPFATETMAELYRSQGHPEAALRVYRQLLTQRPDDVAIQARIAEIEAVMEAAPSSPPSPPAQNVPDLDASSFIFDSSTETPEAEPASDAASPAVPEGGLLIEPPAGLVTDEQPADGLLEGSPVIEGAREPEGPAEPEPVAGLEESPAETVLPRPAGPSIREFLAALGKHVLGGGRTDQEPAETDDPAGETASAETDDVAVEERETTVAVAGVDLMEDAGSEPDGIDVVEGQPGADAELQPGAEPQAGSPATGEGGGQRYGQGGGSIDVLFEPTGVSDEDQAAAEGLAGAFGATPADSRTPPTPMAGAPARRATEELSLDSVFREQRPSASANEARRFSFDKFFANPTPAMGSSSVSETPPLGQPSESPDDDIEQFNSWLDGLKKR